MPLESYLSKVLGITNFDQSNSLGVYSQILGWLFFPLVSHRSLMISSSLKTLNALYRMTISKCISAAYISLLNFIHMSNFLFSISNELPDRYVQHILSKTDLMIFLTSHALISIFPISVHSRSTLWLFRQNPLHHSWLLPLLFGSEGLVPLKWIKLLEYREQRVYVRKRSEK